jgi:ribosomal protein L35
VKRTNPRGNKKAKLLYGPSANHHLMTKRSRKAKRRKSNVKVVDKTIERKYKAIGI